MGRVTTLVLGVLLLVVAAPGLQRGSAQTDEAGGGGGGGGAAAADEDGASANARRPAGGGAPRKAAVENLSELDYDSNFGSPDAAELEVGGREGVRHCGSICLLTFFSISFGLCPPTNRVVPLPMKNFKKTSKPIFLAVVALNPVSAPPTHRLRRALPPYG